MVCDEYLDFGKFISDTTKWKYTSNADWDTLKKKNVNAIPCAPKAM